MSAAWSRIAGLAAADLLVFVAACPGPELMDDLGAPRQWLARVGPDTAAATLAAAGLWLVACWVAIGLLAVAAAELPGGTGRLAARLAAIVVPRALLRLVAGAAGLGVLVAPVVASAQRAPGAPAWPSSAAPSAPAWPTAPAPGPRRPGPDHHPARAGTPSAARPSPPPVHVAAGRPVSVRPGESLWSIAAHHLPAGRRDPARIAAAWPRWYAANRHVIGADPDHIEVGQHLRPPTAPRTEPGE